MLPSRQSQVTIDYEGDGIWEDGGTVTRDLNRAILSSVL